MLRICRRVLILSIVGLLPAAVMGMQSDADIPVRKPLTVDAALRNEAIGMAGFSPDGRWLAYNLVPPYDELTDYSYWMYAFSLSGHQLWIRSMEDPGPPRLQPGLRKDASNYFFGYSEDGEYVVVLEHFRGRLDVVACRIGEDSCVRLGAMPDIRDKYLAPAPWNERLVWVSETKLLMPVRKDDLPGSELRSRAAVGRYLAAQWSGAWDGTLVTASEVRSTEWDRSRDWAEGQLLEFDVSEGESRILAGGRFAGLRVSPDRRFAFAARVGERLRPSPEAGPRRSETHPMFDRRYAPVLFDLEEGSYSELPSPFMIDPHSATWAADGSRFAFYGWEADELPGQGRFYIVEPPSLFARPLRHEGVILSNSRLNPRSEWFSGPAAAILLDHGLAVHGRTHADRQPGWMLLDLEGKAAPREPGAGKTGLSGHPLYRDASGFHVLSDQGLLRLSATEPARLLLTTSEGVLQDLHYRGNPGHAWSNEFRFDAAIVRAEAGPAGALRVTDATGSEDRKVLLLDHSDIGNSPRELPLALTGARILAASLPAGAVIYSVKDGAATRLMLTDSGGGEPEELAVINEHLNEIARSATQQVRYEVPDQDAPGGSRTVTGCLILPPDHQPGRTYPLLLEVYPVGTGGGCTSLLDAPVSASLSAAADLWSARGFAYFRPAMPLDLARTDEGPVAGMNVLAEAAIDALVEQGYADPRRVVLFGFSQGGVSALYVAARSDRFAAVISMHGWADFFSHYFGARGLMRYFHLDQNGGDNRWRYECAGTGTDHNCPFGFGGSAFDHPALYAGSSPVALARDITAPVMLIHSDLDYFDMAQYDEMFGALYRAGREARYVRYWGEGHSPSSPANIRDLWRRIDAFLVEHGIMPGH